ncbi:MAG: alpha/beta hydrolase [Herbaspirillum sp.]|jgi:pimeloyl-ACP methyl ester carboxylesterase|nr:alpha/beta hydrolase [Herbaspirillum sp.]
MTKPILHFAHANSYPAGTYRLFFERLRQHYDIHAMAMHAHNPDYPVDDGWTSLGRELSDELARRYSAPVILVGHSLGGILSLIAARNRPDLVRCVVLLDSPIVAGWRAMILRLMKAFNVEHKHAPSRFSVKRRNVWPDRESSYRHFASKRVFAAWPEEVLRDYVEHGISEQENGVGLSFSRETETAIYRTIPHDLGKLTKQNFPVPVGFIGGEDSVECRLAGLAATRRLVGENFIQIPGGHLFPMATPEAAAEAVNQMINTVLSEAVSINVV